MIPHNNIILHIENCFVAANINKNQTKRQWIFHDQILLILLKYQKRSALIQT